MKRCVLCNGEITVDSNGWAGGHNARPIAIGRCCSICNRIIVEPAQLREAMGRLLDPKLFIKK